MTRDERTRRFTALREIGCIACRLMGDGTECGKVEIHHLNFNGKAGGKRLGDEFTIPLGAWAHRGEPPYGMSATEAKEVFGPSLARNSREFRLRFGDDSFLLDQTNMRIARL